MRRLHRHAFHDGTDGGNDDQREPLRRGWRSAAFLRRAEQVARLLEAVGSRFDGAKVGAHPKAIYIHTAIHIVATKNRMMLA
jgi:hypothetical protein